MEINIKATDEEKKLVVESLDRLNKIRHLKYMSQNIIAEDTGIKSTKVRIVLQDLMNEKAILQYAANEDKRVNRYYYVITDSGAAAFLK